MTKQRVDRRNRVQKWVDGYGDAIGAPGSDAPWPEGVAGFVVTCFALVCSLLGALLAWAVVLGIIALIAIGGYVVFT